MINSPHSTSHGTVGLSARPETENTVRLHDVSFGYGSRDYLALKGINLEIQAGTWCSLIGPNGCGKSTLLHCIAGLNRCEGDIEVASLDPRRASRRTLAQNIALMPQQPIIPEGMLIGDYVALGRAPYRGRGKHVVDEVLRRLGLESYASRLLTDVSGGELQRVVLARALTQQPSVLLLDEPTSALDVGKAQQVMELVDHIRKDSELTVVAALHDLTLAAQYSDQVIFLANGGVVAEGTPAEALTQDRIEDVYGASVRVIEQQGAPVVIPERPVQP